MVEGKLEKGRGRGFALSHYKNLGAYCAVAVELKVEHETSCVRLRRAVSASPRDSGQAVNKWLRELPLNPARVKGAIGI